MLVLINSALEFHCPAFITIFKKVFSDPEGEECVKIYTSRGMAAERLITV